MKTGAQVTVSEKVPVVNVPRLLSGVQMGKVEFKNGEMVGPAVKQAILAAATPNRSSGFHL